MFPALEPERHFLGKKKKIANLAACSGTTTVVALFTRQNLACVLHVHLGFWHSPLPPPPVVF